MQIPVALLSKTQVCGRLITENAISNPAQGMDRIFCVFLVL
jgi:hypothetical protein